MYSLERPNESSGSNERRNISEAEKRTSGKINLKIIFKWRKEKKMDGKELTLLFQNLRGIKRYTYKQLHSATQKFSSKLQIHDDEFHTLFNGQLKNDGLEALIKRLKCFEGLDIGDLFKIEVLALAILKHPNIVKCIGWCQELNHFLVVQESKSIGPLYTCLHSSNNLLSWNQRYKISVDLASAILYLHEGDYLHRNITSKNVLLTSDFNAMLTSFMLAKLPNHGVEEEKVVQILEMKIKDLPRYIVTKAFDIHHFGIIVLELATGLYPDEIQDILLRPSSWHMFEMSYDNLGRNFDKLERKRLVEIGMLCTLHTRSCPSMKEVVEYLEHTDHKIKTPPMDVMHASSSTSSLNIQVRSIWNETPDHIFPSQLQASTSSSVDMKQLSSNLNGDYGKLLSIEKGKQVMASDKLAENQIIEEQMPVDLELSLCDEHFDIGIPHDYNSNKPLTKSGSEFIKSFAINLHDKLNVEIQFNEVLEIICGFTSTLIALNIPLKQWDSFAQYVLRQAKKIVYLRTRYNEEVLNQAPRTLSLLKKEIEDYDALIEEENSAKKMHASLTRMLEYAQSKVVELNREILEMKERCRSLEAEIESKKKRREQNVRRSEQLKAEYTILTNLCSRISSFSFDG